MARCCAIKADGVSTVWMKTEIRRAKTYVQEYIKDDIEYARRKHLFLFTALKLFQSLFSDNIH